MDWRTPAGTLAVAGVVCAVLGIVANFAVENTLFLGSEMELVSGPAMQMAALASLAVIVGSLVVFMALGRPWRLWARTPYW